MNFQVSSEELRSFHDQAYAEEEFILSDRQGEEYSIGPDFHAVVKEEEEDNVVIKEELDNPDDDFVVVFDEDEIKDEPLSPENKTENDDTSVMPQYGKAPKTEMSQFEYSTSCAENDTSSTYILGSALPNDIEIAEDSTFKNTEIISANIEMTCNKKDMVLKNPQAITENPEITAGNSEIIAGDTGVKTGNTDVTSGITHVKTGTNDVITESTDVTSMSADLITGTTNVTTGTNQTITGSTPVVTGNSQIITGNSQVNTGSSTVVTIVTGNPPMVSGNSQVIMGNSQIVSGKTQVIAGKTQVIAGKPQIITGKPQMKAGNTHHHSPHLPKIISGKHHQVITGKPTIISGKSSVITGKSPVITGKPQIITGNTQVVTGSTKVPTTEVLNIKKIKSVASTSGNGNSETLVISDIQQRTPGSSKAQPGKQDVHILAFVAPTPMEDPEEEVQVQVSNKWIESRGDTYVNLSILSGFPNPTVTKSISLTREGIQIFIHKLPLKTNHTIWNLLGSSNALEKGQSLSTIANLVEKMKICTGCWDQKCREIWEEGVFAERGFVEMGFTPSPVYRTFTCYLLLDNESRADACKECRLEWTNMIRVINKKRRKATEPRDLDKINYKFLTKNDMENALRESRKEASKYRRQITMLHQEIDGLLGEERRMRSKFCNDEIIIINDKGFL